MNCDANGWVDIIDAMLLFGIHKFRSTTFSRKKAKKGNRLLCE